MKVHRELTPELEERLELHLVGSLPAAESEGVEAHLAHCAVCRAAARRLSHTIGELLATAPERQPAADLWGRVVERVHGADLRPSAAAALAGLTFVPRGAGDWETTRAEGVFFRTLHVDQETRRRTMMVRMEPGTTYPGHVHGGAEECFVVHGDIRVGDAHMHAGDYQRAEAGSRHGVQSTDAGCVLLIMDSLDDSFAE